MKSFIEVFLMCFILCVITTIFFGGLILSNIWAILFLVALILAIFVTTFINQDSRITELEKKIEQLLQEKHN